jgi:ABC-type antimicrobial peptide transport system permease subunit
MFFFTYLRRELRRRMRQAVVIAAGLALGIALVITVTAMSSGVRAAQGKVLGALFGVGTDITVTTPTAPVSGSAGFTQITPEPYAQHQDVLSSPTQGTMNAAAVPAIARLRDVSTAVGGLALTEIKATIPADNAPPPPTFQPPVQISVTGVDLSHGALGPLAAARLVSGQAFSTSQADADVALADSAYATASHLTVGSAVTIAGTRFTVIGIVRQTPGSNAPELYIPMARAQVLAKLSGKVNVVYVQATSAADVGSVASQISRLFPSATVTDSASLARGVAGSLKTTAQLATSLGTWLAVLALLAAVAIASLLTLAAVGRRVREFGTLKALGWRSGRITAQVMGETIAMGFAGAAAGIALGLGGALAASAAAPKLTATVQTADNGPGGFGGNLGAGGGIFHATIGGPVETFANPDATHNVAVPFTAPVTVGAIVLAVILAIAGALVAGSFGGWRISQLRPAEALRRVE